MPSSVTILAYHRIATPSDQPELASTLIDAYPKAFEAQMRHLATQYNVISSWDLVRSLRGGYTLPRRAMIITFDDGYRCFKETAWPILHRLSLPVTLFVPTYFPSHAGILFWWDALHRALMLTEKSSLEVRDPACEVRSIPLLSTSDREAAFTMLVPMIERLAEREAAQMIDEIVEQCAVEPNATPHMLTWEEIEAFAAEGVSIGPHTRNHTILAQLTPERARDEVEWSWSDLQARIAQPLPIFCYPNGKPHAINRTAVEAVRHSGLVGAYTMVAGLNRVGRTNPYLMHRVGAVAGESLHRFKLKITSGGRLYRRVKGLARRAPEAFKI